MRQKTIEEIINSWKEALEEDVSAFDVQAEKLRRWENEIRAAQKDIVHVGFSGAFREFCLEFLQKCRGSSLEGQMTIDRVLR